MKDIDELKIYIVVRDAYSYQVFTEVFSDCENVSAFQKDIRRFCDEHDEIECLVSPANAFGFMTGGYDAALSDILGWDFQKKVQKYIKDHFYGEQVVGTSFYIETDNLGVSLIHTPTMKYPSEIKDDMIVYYCMRSTLMCALENDVNTIVIPVFGGGCGGVEPDDAAKRMREGYMQIKNRTGANYNF